MAGELNVLCAGAVKGLVLALQDAFEDAAGVRIRASFNAVGALRDALRDGAACDVFIATDAMVASLQASGELDAAPRRAIGAVQTAIAVRASAPLPAIDDAASLAAALRAANAIYFPDATLSTAGAHVASMLARLGLREALAARLHMFANGATAMRQLAASGDDAALGCTQATEIRATPGLALVAALPAPFALATVYSASIGRAARGRSVAAHAGLGSAAREGIAHDSAATDSVTLDSENARRFVDLLAGATSESLRAESGFDRASP